MARDDGYELLDSGAGRKLERFGRVVLARPAAQAVWRPALPEAAVAEAIRSAGAEALYLPAFSPDLNPIEKMRSKIKATLRAIAARTSPALHRAIRKAVLQVTPRDAASWFASCGYTFS